MDPEEKQPRDDEFDVHGLTHPGLVRENNQDHFLLCSLFKRLKIHATSLPNPQLLQGHGGRLSFMAMVADGVGGAQAGQEASRIALETVARYVAESMECYYTGDPTQEQRFLEQLHLSAMECHVRVCQEAEADPSRRGMATTLTLAIGHWPWTYVVQVGDSRCYQLHAGELTQITRDQTVAQDLHDRGMLSTSELQDSRLSNFLSSAIGGPKTVPAANRTRIARGDAILLCSDGLIKHVSDERIRERLLALDTAKGTCEALLQDALDGGGEDNITIIVGRAAPAGEKLTQPAGSQGTASLAEEALPDEPEPPELEPLQSGESESEPLESEPLESEESESEPPEARTS